ncbi:class I SAM-dependent methyltransferase [Tateyamaria sp. ANG-S1]|uniref:class I SAM-dependent methyltransferase n=1 Tax=Tateyamaria sp. ANG-S1 TaxID=1577905 RepID=UPI00057E05A2|nr:class I SAM-dependent methyltransferase [Tateyamaria sp. ANG-S1]KIC52041.1 ubiquinone biosynthesis protein UbiE [Tateyamaria sp. ANG-S1]
MQTKAQFWDGIAVKYAAQPISDPDAYAQTLERVSSYLKPTDRVLELGCGTGSTALTLAEHAGSILATDYSEGMIAQATAKMGVDNVRFLQADVFSPDLQDGAYDVVMAFNLFHLVVDVDAALARVHDLLTPGGLFITKSPCIGERSLGFKFGLLKRLIPLMQLVGKAPYVRFDTIADVDARIARAGFEIIETGNYPMRPPNHFVVARTA